MRSRRTAGTVAVAHDSPGFRPTKQKLASGLLGSVTHEACSPCPHQSRRTSRPRTTLEPRSPREARTDPPPAHARIAKRPPGSRGSRRQPERRQLQAPGAAGRGRQRCPPRHKAATTSAAKPPEPAAATGQRRSRERRRRLYSPEQECRSWHRGPGPSRESPRAQLSAPGGWPSLATALLAAQTGFVMVVPRDACADADAGLAGEALRRRFGPSWR
jgi:hypothetical protein